MRKYNTICSIIIILLLGVHAVTGMFQLTGVTAGGGTLREVFSWVMGGFVVLHIIMGTILTVQTMCALKAAGKAYFRENIEFWVRRISGLALILLIFYHVIIFTGESGEVFRLNTFAGLELAGSLLLVLALSVHIASNIRPLLISFGIAGRKVYVRDILLILAIVCVACAAAFLVYYFRWNISWRYGS